MENKRIMTYADFKTALNESRVDEGKIGDAIKGALKKVKDFFVGTGSQFLNMLLIQDKNPIDGLTYIPSKSDLVALGANGEHVRRISAVRESFIEKLTKDVAKEIIDLNEEYKIDLDFTVDQLKDQADVENVDGDTLKFFIDNYIDAVQNGNLEVAPIHIWGAPGIGKTEIVTNIAEKWGFTKGNMRMIVVDLRSKNAEDLFLPYVQTGKGGDEPIAFTAKSAELPMYWSGSEGGNEKVNGVDGKGGVLFFDEMARARETVKNATLGLFDSSRSIGNWILGDKWSLLACSNRMDDERDNETYNWNTAITARFQHYNYSPKFKDWEKWALMSKSKDGSLKVVPEILQFAKYWGAASDADFKHGGGKYFYDMEPGKEVGASPRSWTRASAEYKNTLSKLEKMAKDKTIAPAFADNLLRTAVAGQVGSKIAIEFMNFVDMVRLISIEDVDLVYTNPAKAPTLKDLEGKLVGISAEVSLRKVSFMMLVSAHKAGKVLTEEECTNVIDWLVAQKDNQQVMPFYTNFSQNVHPYIDPDWRHANKLTSTEQIEKAEKEDPTIKEKIKINEFFWANDDSAPGNVLTDGYPDLFK